ncbi:antiterminator LoaP [Ruminococcus sp. CLA-AA-H200]|uniref:Antiterminator LoaP n=1 Tax=Ruminococcus turbiniformis TaxID=2881258 RepID=A0ABS8FZZ4_9FIRM|nr:antiterminator LoaP [Ruminococcus turbiniformis]MCC2255204.1 antiterminator LoaP [Ruminococcus turbiniformis]
MWYVMQVRTGTEESIRLQCRSNISEAVLEHCFIPYYEEKKRIRGEWTIQKKVLFPGYVFVVTEKMEQLYESLKTVIGLTKLIGTGREIVPLTEEEQQFLLGFGGEDQVVEMSEGIIEGEKILVTKGPLVGKEGYIRKIDRHKRKAWLEMEMFGRVQEIEAGLEIVRKSGTTNSEHEIKKKGTAWRVS